MRWQMGRRSTNVEDRRGAGGLIVGGGGSIVVLLIAMLLGFDPRALLQQVQQQAPPTSARSGAPTDTQGEFVSVVLAETEDVWREQFRKLGREYTPPRLVLFDGQVQSACGLASTAVGPFYCPEDQRVYLDTSFFDLLERRLGAPGDFARAYVIAHEIGHHVQNQLGTMERMRAMKGRVAESDYNRLSVRLELQADFLAGVWAHYTAKMKDVIEQGDIEQAMAAASAIGDDKLQQESQGYVVPDSFTHGTSAQRARWFRLGYETGDVARGDTFGDAMP